MLSWTHFFFLLHGSAWEHRQNTLINKVVCTLSLNYLHTAINMGHCRFIEERNCLCMLNTQHATNYYLHVQLMTDGDMLASSWHLEAITIWCDKMAAGGQTKKQLNLASCAAMPDPFKLTLSPLNLFTWFSPCIKSCMLKVYTLEQFER